MSVRDVGPPVMQQTANFEANAPIRSYPQSAVRAISPLVAPNNPRLFREVFGFAFASSLGDPTIGYPSWDFSLLSTVAYFGVHVTWNGALSNDSGLQTWNNPNGPTPGFISAAHAQGTKVVLTIEMFDSTAGTPIMCSALYGSAATISLTVDQVLAKGIDGVNVDYESNNTNCTDPNTGAVQSSQSLFTAFVRDLRHALPTGSYISVDSYSGAAGYRSGSTYYGFFDIGALANYTDSFFVMAYDMEYENSSAPPLNCASFCVSPTAPLTTYLFNDTRASTEYRAVVPGSKVLMGIPYYGRKECVNGYTPSNAPPSAIGNTVGADGYLDASTENGYYLNSDYHIHREGLDTQGNERWDTWTSSGAGCTREMYWDDVTSLGNKYNLIINDGLRGAGIFALNYGGGAPELWSLINLKFGQCSEAAIAADHPSPQLPGTSIKFTGSAFCAGTAQYRFWNSPPGSPWSIAQDYSTTATTTWDTTGLALGTYRWEVDARNLGSSVSYDTAAYALMRLALCLTPTLTPDKASPQLPSTIVTFTSTVTCRGTPEYRFWRKPIGGQWSIVQDYSSSATLRWDTTGTAYGNYSIEVDARTQGTTVTYESVQYLPYSLTSCISSALTTDKASPQPTGTQVKLTGATTCDGTPQYRFVIQPPGGSASVVQDFGASNTFTWNAGGPGGTYALEVDTKSAAAPAASMVTSLVPYTLVACSGATITGAPVSPQVPGTAIVLTGAATCTGTPQYRFQMHAPGAPWAVVRDYTSAATYNWNTTGLPIGDYGIEVDIRNTGATSDYETSLNDTFTMSRAACTTPTLTSDVASPQGTGATITFTSTTTTCPTPVYRFWVKPPGGSWGIAQDYGSPSTFKWLASGDPGVYGVEVDVRDASRPVPYDFVANVSYTLTACTGATLTTDVAPPQVPGATVTLTAGATCPRTPEFRFWVKPPGGTWGVVQDFGGAKTFAWHTSNPGGSYGLEVDVRDQGAIRYETTASLSFGLTAPCNLPSLNTNVASPQGVGTAVIFTAATSGCPTPTYRFWVQPPGGSFAIQQDWGPSATFNWATTGLPAGVYGFEADVRQQGSTVPYDAARGAVFTLVSVPCASPTLKPSIGPPGGTSTPVTFTGAASGCTAPEFRFWIRPPGGIWTIARDYAASATFLWPGGAPGSYGFEVDARTQGTSVSYEAVANITYAVVACTVPSLSTNVASPQPAATPITFTAATSGCPTPQYRFWVQPPGGSFAVQQDWGSSAAFNWNTTALAAGVYGFEVDVRNQGSTLSYESARGALFTLTTVPCSAPTLKPSIGPPSGTGAPVTFTGTATGCSTPEFRFWMRTASGSWIIIRDYATTPTYVWPGGGDPGAYSFEVDTRAVGSPVSYDAVVNITYAVVGCSAATLSANPASPQAAGTPIVLTGGATCLGTPEFRFWIKPPGGSWTVVRAYSGSSTFTWTTTGLAPGPYSVEVDVRNQGANADHETVQNITFTIS
ncbi:MAG TPA: glycosyl hydrolase family 18 protein [Candidatus Dormibacteraeota bacterium]|nr:glycosyl hydrolase family 18 protein [Candidatus Dormibacteraeota bacterium]